MSADIASDKVNQEARWRFGLFRRARQHGDHEKRRVSRAGQEADSISLAMR